MGSPRPAARSSNAPAVVTPLRAPRDRRGWVRIAALVTLVLFVVFLILRRGRLW